ncbi:unnamed protein product [Macrosiphum euphorbiae]|uniref:Uncharacterized protein n=1 Tax=Macrosiphum euphorbiae TaxID=13131 RepID=A0AAV0W329_9HEMI|nr:unnamed protein product [Macrosiphum euphorbiae]
MLQLTIHIKKRSHLIQPSSQHSSFDPVTTKQRSKTEEEKDEQCIKNLTICKQHSAISMPTETTSNSTARLLVQSCEQPFWASPRISLYELSFQLSRRNSTTSKPGEKTIGRPPVDSTRCPKIDRDVVHHARGHRSLTGGTQAQKISIRPDLDSRPIESPYPLSVTLLRACRSRVRFTLAVGIDSKTLPIWSTPLPKLYKPSIYIPT